MNISLLMAQLSTGHVQQVPEGIPPHSVLPLNLTSSILVRRSLRVNPMFSANIHIYIYIYIYKQYIILYIYTMIYIYIQYVDR